MIVIDYRQLLDKIDNPPYTLYSAGDRAAWLDECITTAHAFDAEPVKHGRWIDNGICDSMLSACSICGYSCGAYSFNYCPNCGARMDGES